MPFFTAIRTVTIESGRFWADSADEATVLAKDMPGTALVPEIEVFEVNDLSKIQPASAA